ncbi:MAG: antibiotic biosynthesis monooxygenase [Candidatus Acidiferrales bacterium]|jgi:heme-degrading monooxygenase HmoA
MYARVWKFVILPGKVEKFTVACRSAIPILQRQAGFRNLLVLRSGPGEMLEGTVISVWDSLDHLRNSETTAFQEMLARVLALCEPRPSMREEEVLISEIASPDPDDTVTKF